MNPTSRIVSIIGASGFGKSSLAVRLIAGDSRVLIAQPYMDNPYGAIICTTYETLKATLRAHNPKSFNLALTVYDKAGLEKFLRLGWLMAPVKIVLDETAFYIENTASAPEELRFIGQIGRHAGPDDKQEVSCIALGQVPSNIPTWYRAESKTVFLFAIDRAPDREKIGKDFSMSAELAADVIARVATLGKLQYIRLDKSDDGVWRMEEGRL